MNRALFLALLTAAGCSAQASELADGEAAFRAGRYQEAIDIFREHLAEGPRAHRGLARALAEVGRYTEAENAVRSFLAESGASGELWNSLGEILREQGNLDEAAEAFTRAVERRASDALTAELNLAILSYERGELEEAMKRFDRFIDVYNRSVRLSAEELTAVGTACRYLGREDPQLLKDALKAFDEAIALAPSDPEPRVRLGELFLETYQSPDAQSTFKEILASNGSHPRALLGMARVADFDGKPEALDGIARALEINPNLVEGHVFRASILLSHESYDEAREEAQKALEVRPNSLDALAVLAAAHFLRGDQSAFASIRARALSLNPRGASFFNDLADIAVKNRLYREAAGFAREAIALDSKSWRGYGLLGMNQLRLGEIDEGRKNLETAFAGDPYHVWIKNTLDLLDTFPQYRETDSGRFRFMIERKESELLAIYMGALAEEAYERLAERYDYRPQTPLRIEVFRSHADFSVRTVGLAGLGALGVCFGRVLALDSPAARDRGRFNWGSTLWHELAHAVTLGMTDHKIPRWFTEGLSVWEERRARPGWGDDVTPDFLIAYKQGALLPVAELNNGFIRPRHPRQIAFSYYQASLLSELIERDWGFPAIRRMLAAYRAGKDTPVVLAEVLEVEPEALDRKLSSFIEERFGHVLESLRAPDSAKEVEVMTRELAAVRAGKDPSDFLAQLVIGRALFEEGKPEEALAFLERAERLFPEYAAEDSAHWYLATIYKERGETERAIEILSRFTNLNEAHYEAHLQLADFLEKTGDRSQAAQALDRAIYISPYDLGLHQRLAGLYAALGEWAGAIRERRAVVALEPVDRAEAFYQLAQAYFLAGDRGGARRELLRALEVAPNFDKAQELLLKIHGRGGGADRGGRPS